MSARRSRRPLAGAAVALLLAGRHKAPDGGVRLTALARGSAAPRRRRAAAP